MLSRRWLPKGTPADATQRNATRQDATQRDKAGQDGTERRRTPTGSTPARPDNLKEVEPCLAAGGSQREHLRTQRNATRQDRTGQDATRRDKAGQDRTERRRTPTGGTPARPDNLKEVEPCLAAGGSRREHLRTRRDTTRRDTTRRNTTRHDATRRKNAHPEHIHTTRMGAHPLPTHNHPFFITKNSSYAIQIPFRQEKTANDRRSQII